MNLYFAITCLLFTACASAPSKFEQSVILYRAEAHALAMESCRDKVDCSLKREVSELRLKQLAQINLASCEASGGLIQGSGMFGEPACVRHFSDGGITCSNSSDCQGDCIVFGDFKPGEIADGQCTADTSNPGGCFAEVIDGKAGPGLCF